MSVFTNDVTVEPGSSPISVTGSAVSVSNFPATQPVSGTVAVSTVGGTVAVTQSTSPWVISGTVTTSAPASTATITRVATSTSSVTLLPSNVNRKKAIIMTETGSTNYVAFGSAATATNYTYLLGASTVLEVTNWTGSITLVRSAGTGNVQVTELV